MTTPKLCLVTCLVSINWEAKRLQAMSGSLERQKWWIKAEILSQETSDIYALKQRAIKCLLGTGELKVSCWGNDNPRERHKGLLVVGYSEKLGEWRSFHTPWSGVDKSRLESYAHSTEVPSRSPKAWRRLGTAYAPDKARLELARFVGW